MLRIISRLLSPPSASTVAQFQGILFILFTHYSTTSCLYPSVYFFREIGLSTLKWGKRRKERRAKWTKAKPSTTKKTTKTLTLSLNLNTVAGNTLEFWQFSKSLSIFLIIILCWYWIVWAWKSSQIKASGVHTSALSRNLHTNPPKALTLLLASFIHTPPRSDWRSLIRALAVSGA